MFFSIRPASSQVWAQSGCQDGFAHSMRESRRALEAVSVAWEGRRAGGFLQASSPVGESLRPAAPRTCTWVTCWG